MLQSIIQLNFPLFKFLVDISFSLFQVTIDLLAKELDTLWDVSIHVALQLFLLLRLMAPDSLDLEHHWVLELLYKVRDRVVFALVLLEMSSLH